MRNRKFQKNSKKIQKPRYGFYSSQNRLENAEKERKLKLSFRFVPTRRIIENSKKKSKKIQKPSFGFFSSRNRLENAEKERKRKLSFRFVPTRRVIENSKKKEKKFKKLKNTIMALFQAKIGWKKLRMEKIKIIVPFRSYTTRNRKLQKNSKKV